MACDNPFDAFRLATESLPDDVYVRASFRDIWTNLIPKEVYPNSAGLVRSTFTIGRSEPTTDEPAFTPITLSTGNTYTGSCGTTYSDVPVGFDEDTYAPEQFGWKGPTICQDDLIFNYKAAMFLQQYIPAITKNTLRTIGNRLAAIYTHYVPKGIADASFTFGNPGTGAPPQSPDLTLDRATCELTQEMLDYTAVVLNQEGASDPNSNGWITLGEDGPIYPLYIGQEMSQRILLQNSDLRQDRRYADMGKGDASMLFQRVGATRVIKNFRHVINLFPPRYNYENGEYVRVPTWVMNSGTKGQVADINPDWTNADFEGAWVLTPWVFHSEVIQPVNSAAGLNWTPKNYMGEWQFITGGEKINNPPCFDPLQKLGAHFAEYKHAPKPIFPTFGRFILFQRCPSDGYNCVSCS